MSPYRPESVSALRRQLDESVETFAERLGVAPLTVRRWEGEKALPRADHLATMAELAAQSSLSFRPFATKEFDVFISYSSTDKAKAVELAAELRSASLQVWLDSNEILVGHNIVDRVYEGIIKSEFLIVLLSPSSVLSQWVLEELSTAKMLEFERRKVIVLPAMIEPCEIPPPLVNKRHATLDKNWARGVRELLAAMDHHRLVKAASAPAPGKRARTFNGNQQMLERLKGLALENGCSSQMPTKDVAIGPPDDHEHLIAKSEIKQLVPKQRADLRGWGGASFPYNEYLPDVQTVPLSDGLLVHDSSPWPYSTQSFHLWLLLFSGHFGQRQDIREDFMTDANARNCISVEWIYKDIMFPFLFARKLQNLWKVPLGLDFEWTGLQNRRLVFLDRRRFMGLQQYVCGMEKWSYRTVIEPEDDLAQKGSKAVEDVLWLFGWESPAMQDWLLKLAAGELPR
jgi:transcriptional regulator with XRE-family HTH domain